MRIYYNHKSESLGLSIFEHNTEQRIFNKELRRMHVFYCARFKVVLAVVFGATSLVPKLCSSSLLTCQIRWHKGNY